MTKSLYAMANTYSQMFKKIAIDEVGDEDFDKQDLLSDTSSDMFDDPSDEDLEDEDFMSEEQEERPFKKRPLGSRTFEDFDPALRAERERHESLRDDYFIDLMSKRKQDKRNKKKEAMVSAVVKMAQLYAKAKRDDTSGAYLEDISDIPMEDEPTNLRDVLSDEGNEEFPSEIERGVDIEEKEDAGDPGEYMPQTEEEIELAKEERAKRLALIRERHEAWKNRGEQPEETESEEETSLEPSDAPALDLDDDDDDDDFDFEDED